MNDVKTKQIIIKNTLSTRVELSIPVDRTDETLVVLGFGALSGGVLYAETGVIILSGDREAMDFASTSTFSRN